MDVKLQAKHIANHVGSSVGFISKEDPVLLYLPAENWTIWVRTHPKRAMQMVNYTRWPAQGLQDFYKEVFEAEQFPVAAMIFGCGSVSLQMIAPGFPYKTKTDEDKTRWFLLPV